MVSSKINNISISMLYFSKKISNFIEILEFVSSLTDTSEDSKLVLWRICTNVDASIFFFFFRRVRATSMTQRRFENTRVHFWTFSPVSVKGKIFYFHNNFETRELSSTKYSNRDRYQMSGIFRTREYDIILFSLSMKIFKTRT